MSKASAAKKARRKRRLAARDDRWLPDDVHADIEGVAHIANQIIPRGWEFDREFSTGGLVTWCYPPSAIEVDDDDEWTEARRREERSCTAVRYFSGSNFSDTLFTQ